MEDFNGATGRPPPLAAASGAIRGRVIQGNFSTTGQRILRRDPPPLPAALVPTDDPLRLRIAEELEYARRMLDALGDELAIDTVVVARHTLSLQSIDTLGQLLVHVANVIRSSDPEGAVERIGMAELKGRLTRRSIC